MKKVMTKLLNKMGVNKLKRLKNNNKGFSLIELLIVIAIMGVLAAIAFNMFGGVLDNSKKRADSQQAKNLEKALLIYCVDSQDWDLSDGAVGEAGAAIDTSSNEGIIKALLQEIVCDGTGNKEYYGPMLSPKFPAEAVTSDNNWGAYMPQSPDFEGWKIDTYASKQSVTVAPEKDETKCTFTPH